MAEQQLDMKTVTKQVLNIKILIIILILLLIKKIIIINKRFKIDYSWFKKRTEKQTSQWLDKKTQKNGKHSYSNVQHVHEATDVFVYMANTVSVAFNMYTKPQMCLYNLLDTRTPSSHQMWTQQFREALYESNATAKSQTCFQAASTQTLNMHKWRMTSLDVLQSTVAGMQLVAINTLTMNNSIKYLLL
jgi:primase-polymerase (primpol)-like protein